MKKFFNCSQFPGLFAPAPSELASAASGIIYGLANDANFDAAHLSEPLTEYITGVPDRDRLQETLDLIAPAVPVGRRFEYKQHNEKAVFQQDADDDSDIREIGADFKVVTSPGTRTDSATDNKGLMIVLDNDQGGENTQVQQYYISMLRNRLLRTELRRAVALIEANAVSSGTPNWGSGNAARDPDADLLTMVDESGDARGINPNVVLLGGTAALRRKLALRGSDKAGAFASGMMTNEQLAEMLEVEKVIVMGARYQSGVASKTKVAGSVAYAYYSQQGATKDDPSNIKRFVTMTASGIWRVYVEQVLKRTKIAVEHYSRIVATSTTGIRKVTPTFTA